jgi:hypothetical protein
VAKKRSKSANPEGGRSRKRRTREHLIAEWSLHHVMWVILENGYAAERTEQDYGYDLHVTTFDEQGFVEAGAIKVQLKGTDHIARYELKDASGVFSYPIEREDHDLWMEEVMPVLFILYDAQVREGYWQHVQAFFADHSARRTETKTLQLHIPHHQVLGVRTMRTMRERKARLLTQAKEVLRHG